MMALQDTIIFAAYAPHDALRSLEYTKIGDNFFNFYHRKIQIISLDSSQLDASNDSLCFSIR